MGFQSFGDQFQGQQGGEEAGGPGAQGAQQQMNPMGQQMEQPQGQFQGGQQGPPGSGGSHEGGDSKTTLWLVTLHLPVCETCAAYD